MKKIPLCALCGLSLKKPPLSRILLQFEGMKSKPMVGWHIDCAHVDPDYLAHVKGRPKIDPLHLLMDIGRRGPGRVT